MTLREISQMIAEIELPYAYNQFTERSATAPPFMCYLLADDDIFADGVNYQRRARLHLELYTDVKSFEYEGRIRQMFNRHRLTHVKVDNDVYIETERMLLNTFEADVIIDE